MMRVMRSLMLGAAVVILAIGAAGCRQADGEIPMPQGEDPNKIQDIARDLQNVAGGAADAATDLRDDLDGFPGMRPPALLRQLTAAVVEALQMKSLPDAQAQELARLLFVAVTAEELSPAQIEQLGNDLEAALASAGADGGAAARVEAAVTELQAAVTLNRKRWYHLF
jgi:hypothetical protein